MSEEKNAPGNDTGSESQNSPTVTTTEDVSFSAKMRAAKIAKVERLKQVVPADATETDGTRAGRAEMFKRLVCDLRISFAARVLWQYLYFHVNHTRGDSVVWPGVRLIRDEIGCSFNLIPVCFGELKAAGWVSIIRKGGRGVGDKSKYLLLDGFGKPLRGVEKPTVTTNRNAPVRYEPSKSSFPTRRNAALRPVEAESITVGKYKEVKVASPSSQAALPDGSGKEGEATEPTGQQPKFLRLP